MHEDSLLKTPFRTYWGHEDQNFVTGLDTNLSGKKLEYPSLTQPSRDFFPPFSHHKGPDSTVAISNMWRGSVARELSKSIELWHFEKLLVGTHTNSKTQSIWQPQQKYTSFFRPPAPCLPEPTTNLPDLVRLTSSRFPLIFTVDHQSLVSICCNPCPATAKTEVDIQILSWFWGYDMAVLITQHCELWTCPSVGRSFQNGALGSVGEVISPGPWNLRPPRAWKGEHDR